MFRSQDNPNEVVLLLEVASAAKFREFARSPDLQQTLERAGVLGQPDILFLDEADRPPA
ncbi:MAG TPA: hypothetical protein VEU62_03740 [Bryobacterales bacterium]|nr:hypothetical protein [Bryobacterales bacterium]